MTTGRTGAMHTGRGVSGATTTGRTTGASGTTSGEGVRAIVRAAATPAPMAMDSAGEGGAARADVASRRKAKTEDFMGGEGSTMAIQPLLTRAVSNSACGSHCFSSRGVRPAAARVTNLHRAVSRDGNPRPSRDSIVVHRRNEDYSDSG